MGLLLDKKSLGKPSNRNDRCVDTSEKFRKEGGDEARLAFEDIGRGKGPDACFGYAHSYTSMPSPRKQAFYYPTRCGKCIDTFRGE